MNQKLTELYNKFLHPEQKKKEPQKLKCKARVKNCKCGYHYKRDDPDVCPQCGEKRKTCERWAVEGKEVCHKHGGHAGRKVSTGVKVSNKTFSEEEMAIIQSNIDKKVREHEYFYQVASMAVKKIIENTSPDDPEHILEGIAIYFSKIMKYMTEIEVAQASIIRKYSFDEIDRKKLADWAKQFANGKVQDCLWIINMILLKEIQDKELYNKIYNAIPQIYRELLEQKTKTFN